jgi:hypothetical protein
MRKEKHDILPCQFKGLNNRNKDLDILVWGVSILTQILFNLPYI